MKIQEESSVVKEGFVKIGMLNIVMGLIVILTILCMLLIPFINYENNVENILVYTFFHGEEGVYGIPYISIGTLFLFMQAILFWRDAGRALCLNISAEERLSFIQYIKSYWFNKLVIPLGGICLSLVLISVSGVEFGLGLLFIVVSYCCYVVFFIYLNTEVNKISRKLICEIYYQGENNDL